MPPKRIGDKAAYLNTDGPGRALRLVVFPVWGGPGLVLPAAGLRQDASGDCVSTAAMERISAPGMILFAFTMTLAAVDLLMSLNPHWSSTIIGVYFFTDARAHGLVVLTLLALWLQARAARRGRHRRNTTTTWAS